MGGGEIGIGKWMGSLGCSERIRETMVGGGGVENGVKWEGHWNLSDNVFCTCFINQF